ncbi:MAG: hypothetical protein AAFO15_02645 [Pseudomonadota bacterium]
MVDFYLFIIQVKSLLSSSIFKKTKKVEEKYKKKKILKELNARENSKMQKKLNNLTKLNQKEIIKELEAFKEIQMEYKKDSLEIKKIFELEKEKTFKIKTITYNTTQQECTIEITDNSIIRTIKDNSFNATVKEHFDINQHNNMKFTYNKEKSNHNNIENITYHNKQSIITLQENQQFTLEIKKHTTTTKNKTYKDITNIKGIITNDHDINTDNTISFEYNLEELNQYNEIINVDHNETELIEEPKEFNTKTETLE